MRDIRVPPFPDVPKLPPPLEPPFFYESNKFPYVPKKLTDGQEKSTPIQSPVAPTYLKFC